VRREEGGSGDVKAATFHAITAVRVKKEFTETYKGLRENWE